MAERQIGYRKSRLVHSSRFNVVSWSSPEVLLTNHSIVDIQERKAKESQS